MKPFDLGVGNADIDALEYQQNPMDLDYRAPSNAGLWFVGRLQTDADRERVIDGLEVSQSAKREKSAEGFKAKLAQTIGRLAPRRFVVRSTYLTDGAVLLTPRWAMSFMRGPMTGSEIRKARGIGTQLAGEHSARTSDLEPPTPMRRRR